MFAIFKKEFIAFYTSPVGYLVMGLFLILNGLFLWVFNTGFNIFEYGFADVSPFFLLAPWVLLMLIPAITMKGFAEERKLGTLELLFSKPVSVREMVWGKFLGVFFLVLLTLLPTLLYVLAVSRLGMEEGNLDSGLVWGSYGGLLLLVAVYSAIGLFASTITDNQIVALMSGLLISFIIYYGFEGISTVFSDGDMALFISRLGLKSHYENISLGILDSRDIIYFLSITGFFILLSIWQLKRLKK